MGTTEECRTRGISGLSHHDRYVGGSRGTKTGFREVLRGARGFRGSTGRYRVAGLRPPKGGGASRIFERPAQCRVGFSG